MKIIDEIDALSQLRSEEDNQSIVPFMYEFVTRVTEYLNIERVNIWLLNQEKKALVSIVEYDKRDNSFKKNTYIYEKDAPNYFQYLKNEKIILAPDIHTNPITYQFSNNYAKENDIISLMDIPLKLSGELIGVICFEKTGKTPRVFSEAKQTFAITLSHLALAQIENRLRKNIEQKLKSALKQKELLIKELNHRVKNNFSVLVSLLRLGKENIHKESEDFLSGFEQQVFSMLKVHELLVETEEYQTIDLSQYLHKLTEEFKSSYADLKNHFVFEIDNTPFNIPIKHSVNLGLIVTEIFLNSLKYCVLGQSGKFELRMRVLSENDAEIVAGDTCNNFDFQSTFQKHPSLGLGIIKDLCEASEFEVSYPTTNCSQYKIIVHKSQ